MTQTIFRNVVFMLAILFCMIFNLKKLNGQQRSPEYFSLIFPSSSDGEVLLINDHYALVVATGRDLEVYSLKT